MKTTLLFLCLFSGSLVIAQEKEPTKYFVTSTNDTVYCDTLNYELNYKGEFKKLSYTDTTGKKVVLTENFPDIVTFYYFEGKILDKVPDDLGSPRKGFKYINRRANGKLIVYLTQQTTKYDSNGNSVPVGVYRFFIKLPDGNIYKINNKKNMKEIIKPYIMNCSDFASQFTGEFTDDETEFLKIVFTYNSLCK